MHCITASGGIDTMMQMLGCGERSCVPETRARGRDATIAPAMKLIAGRGGTQNSPCRIPDLFYCRKHMPRGELLGSLEQIVLLALIRLGDNAYGMTVRREIEERTGRDLSIGAVYATLERLESKGYVSSAVGEPTPERGGRAKRHFRIEAAGERALRTTQQAMRSMSAGLKTRWSLS
jgi:DNA-binding PadR family transcriptional regulator